MLIFFAVFGGFILDAIFGDPGIAAPGCIYGQGYFLFRSKLAGNFAKNTAWRAHRRRNHRIHPACRHIPASGAVCFFFYKIHWVFGL